MKKKIIKARKKPRQGWDACFKLMRACGEDRLLIPDSLDVILKKEKSFLRNLVEK
jgi:hypothetical protein